MDETPPPGLIQMIQEPFGGEDLVTAVRDPGALAGLLEVLEPIATEDFVTEMVGDPSFRRERIGVEGFLEAWRDWTMPFEELRIDIDEMHQIGPKLLTLVEQVGRAKGSPTEIREPAAAVWTVADGKLVRAEFHLDIEEAKRSAGFGA